MCNGASPSIAHSGRRREGIRNAYLFVFLYLFLFPASSYAYGSEEDFTFQAGKSIDVCMGDTRSTAVTENLRPKHDSISQLREPDFEEWRLMVG